MSPEVLVDRDPQSHFSVERAANALGVSPRRVRALLAHGQLEGHREGGMWLVDRKSVAARAGRRLASNKSLVDGSLRLLVERLSQHLGAEPADVWFRAEPVERYRAKERVDRLVHHEQPAALLRAWAAPEASAVIELNVSDDYARALMRNELVHASGISHPISFMSPSMALEVHAPKAERRRIERQADVGRIRVLIHSPGRDWSLGEVPVDLALHNGRREDDDVRRILTGAR